MSLRFKAGWCTACNTERAGRLYDRAFHRDGKRATIRRYLGCTFCGNELVLKGKDRPAHARGTPTRTVEGKLRASATEARREDELIGLARAGIIKDLQAQVPIRLYFFGTAAVEALLEAIEADDDLVRAAYAGLRRLAGEVRRSKQRICTYIADAVYTDHRGVRVVEDTKGRGRKGGARTTPIFRLKQRLFEAATGEEITVWVPAGRKPRR